MASISLVSWLWRPTCGLRDVGWGDIGLAVALSLLGVLAVTGLVRPTPPHGGVIAAVAVLGMTAPVAVERRLSVVLLGYLAAHGMLHGMNNLLETACALTVFCSAIFRQLRPEIAGLTSASALTLAGLAGSSASFPGGPLFVPAFLLAYSLGTSAQPRRALGVLGLLGISLQLATGIFNPFAVFVITAPWMIGRLIRSRRDLAEQLATRGLELQGERALFAAEAVRYERAQIARELHDIVAHCVSVMVIQAGAGQRIARTDPMLITDTFDAIAEVARQAQEEIGRLAELLPARHAQADGDGVNAIAALVARASTAGLAVDWQFTGQAAELRGATADVAYRVVQESLTNAFKHAPGARVNVTVVTTPGEVKIIVTNGQAVGTASGLQSTGSGRGLTGIRERVAVCGGEVTAGPSGDGWQLTAILPAEPARNVHSPS